MWFSLPCCSLEVQSQSPSLRGEMMNTKKVECSLAVTVPLQGWKRHFCIGSSIISPCTALSLCKELRDLAPLKAICMALLVYLQFSPFGFILMALL